MDTAKLIATLNQLCEAVELLNGAVLELREQGTETDRRLRLLEAALDPAPLPCARLTGRAMPTPQALRPGAACPACAGAAGTGVGMHRERSGQGGPLTAHLKRGAHRDRRFPDCPLPDCQIPAPRSHL